MSLPDAKDLRLREKTLMRLPPPHFHLQPRTGLHPRGALRQTGIFLRISIKYKREPKETISLFGGCAMLHFILFYFVLGRLGGSVG